MSLKVPMMVGGEIAGLMGIRFTERRNLLPDEIDIVQSFANQAMLSLRLCMLTAQKREAAVIDERNRMAREIHDTLAQGFTGVIVQMEAAEEALNQRRAEKVPQFLRNAADLARESLHEARRSVKALRPEILEKKNLGQTLKDVIERMTHGIPLRSEFNFQGEQRELPSEWENNLLRIGTEVLTNTLRHSKASEFHGSLVFDRDEILLNFWDNGIGFKADAKNEGYGLKGMLERADSIGAILSIKSSVGEGTRVEIVLPLKGEKGNPSS
jgi:signal transduction histidine kinase